MRRWNSASPKSRTPVVVASLTVLALALTSCSDDNPTRPRTTTPPTVVLNPANGHYYHAIAVAGGITWEQAKAAADTTTFMGMQGYLATVADQDESTFLLSSLGVSPRLYWLGGFQDLGAPDFSEPGGAWRWITGEPTSFDGWAVGQPSGSGNSLAYDTTASGWKDFSSDSDTLSGYVVEFGNRVDLDTSQYYRLTNLFLGGGRSLDVVPQSVNVSMRETADVPSQMWKLIPDGTGLFNLENKFNGGGISLEGGAPGGCSLMNATCCTGQYWKITGDGNGRYRLTNDSLGEDFSFEGGDGAGGCSLMTPTGLFSGQAWYFTPLGPIEVD